MGSIDGKVAIITRAGSVVGRAMAGLFAKHGSNVAVVDVVTNRVNRVVSEIGSSSRKPIGIVHDFRSSRKQRQSWTMS